MNGMTISEMADKLKLPRDTIKRRLLRANCKPFSQEALYTAEDFEKIRNVPGKGRPKKTETTTSVKKKSKPKK
jgi:predicted ArsR family transcriptional regulator